MLMSIAGKISTGDTDELDFDRDLPKIPSVKEGLHQYYDLQKQTDVCSLNTGRVMAKIGVNEREDVPTKIHVDSLQLNTPSACCGGVSFFHMRILSIQTNQKVRATVSLLVWIVVCELAGVLGTLFTVSAIPTWYATIVKPTFNPPSWLFGPVWTILYALMGTAVFLIWQKGVDRREVRTAIVFFVFQLVLNALWSMIFFGAHSIGGALIEIVILWFAIIMTILAFAKISKPAAWLLLPYIAWVSFAAYLNFALWTLN